MTLLALTSSPANGIYPGATTRPPVWKVSRDMIMFLCLEGTLKYLIDQELFDSGCSLFCGQLFVSFINLLILYTFSFSPGFNVPPVQQCPDPGEVVNGARSVHPESGFAVGTVVRFTCNQGYQLEGPSQISCHGRDTGMPKWSDRSPKCVCEYMLVRSVRDYV